MSPLSALGIGAVVGLLVGTAAGWTAQGWRGTAQTQTQVAVVATERADAATAARTAEADQRLIEFHRQEAANDAFQNYRARLVASDAAARNRDAAITRLRNALTAANARSGQTSIDSSSGTGADDPRTLRKVAGECTAAFATMAEHAVNAGITLTSLQAYALGVTSRVIAKAPALAERSPDSQVMK